MRRYTACVAGRRRGKAVRSHARKLLPAPVKRALVWLAGWVFAARRRLRRNRHGAATSSHSGSPSRSPGARDPRLPADAPDALIASNEHGLYCVPCASLHRPVAQLTVASQVSERATLELLCASDSAGDIVHAGTYFGDFLPALSASRGEGALIWAFEPGNENHRCAQITVELNGLQNVVLSHAGLSAQPKRALLATGDSSGVPLGGMSRVVTDPTRARWWDTEEVELLMLDEAIGRERHVATIHLDVEGHEQQALEGGLELIARCRPLLVLETLPSQEWLHQRLEPLGYRGQAQVDLNHVLASG